MLLFLVSFSACAPSYWMRPSEWSRVPHVDTVEAENDAGEIVKLRAEKLDDAVTETDGDLVRVHPSNTRYKAAAGLLTVGTILAAASMAAFLSQLAPCQGDEACWVPQTISGATLGAFAGVSLIIGSSLLPSALNDNYAR
jgi:hypothetical protein